MNNKKELKHLEWKLKQLKKNNRRFKIISTSIMLILILMLFVIL